LRYKSSGSFAMLAGILSASSQVLCFSALEIDLDQCCFRSGLRIVRAGSDHLSLKEGGYGEESRFGSPCRHRRWADYGLITFEGCSGQREQHQPSCGGRLASH
jgi:hypothetical protein